MYFVFRIFRSRSITVWVTALTANLSPKIRHFESKTGHLRDSCRSDEKKKLCVNKMRLPHVCVPASLEQ